MTNLDHIFGDVLGQLEELQADAKAIVEKRTEKEEKNLGK